MILLRKFRRRWNRFFYVFAVFFLVVTGGCTMFPWMPVDTSRGNMSDLGETAKKPVQITGANLSDVIWINATCPDGTNSDTWGGTCEGHLSLP